jgi:3-(3-hydroxy-phenyl)propionate hydroxylase
MCSGLRDAANLAWKLTAVIADDADEALLDSYQPEREPNLRAMIQMAIMMGQTVCITDPEAAAARDAQMLAARAAGHSPDGNIEYPPISSGMILADTPAAGCYFAQPVAADGSRLDDVLGMGHWLIGRADLGRPQLAPFAEQLGSWLDKHQAQAVLVRPDRYVFGTGTDARLQEAWTAKVLS